MLIFIEDHNYYSINTKCLMHVNGFLGNFRRDSCNYSPSSSPDVINVGGTQQAVDDPHPGMYFTCKITNPLLLHT